MLVLGIETSCDETGVALVADGRLVRSNVLADQQTLHARYGGVVPEVASRAHVDLLHPAVEQACALGGARLGDVDAVAVTIGPGLAGSLLVGVAAAKAYALALDRPLVGVNHLVAHVYANVLDHGTLPLPAVVFVVSGGHTSLLAMDEQGAFRGLGQTIDDAAGEAYDKVARVLGLGYPGGPVVDRLARDGDPAAVRFPRALLDDGSDDFSFSGLKTAVLRHVRAAGPDVNVADVAASFQEAVVDVQISKVVGVAKREGLDTVLLGGGVAANSRLRARLAAEAEHLGLRLLVPSPALCTDNGAMVACAGSFALERGERTPLDVGADPNLQIVPGFGRRAPRRPKRRTGRDPPPPDQPPEGRRAPGVLAGLRWLPVLRRSPSGSHGPVRVPAVGGGPAGQDGGAAGQASDQAEQQDGQRVDATAGRGRDRLGGDGDHGSGVEAALARPDLLDGGLGALGLGGLDAAEQPVVLVLGHGAAGCVGGAGAACSTPVGAGRRWPAAWVRLPARFSPAGTGTGPCLVVEVLGGHGDGGVPVASARLSASTVSAR